jgi:choline-sulfatase
MVRTLTHKLVARPLGVSELYDLQKDPRELVNVYEDPAYAEVRATLEAQLLAWYVRTADVVPVGEDPRRLP